MFHMSSYEENFENVARTVEMVTSIRPDARLVITVSPVGLGRTFGPDDILVANCEGKSILRAVVVRLPASIRTSHISRPTRS